MGDCRAIIAREKECEYMMEKALEGEWVLPFVKLPSVQNYISYSRYVTVIKLSLYQEVHNTKKEEKLQKLIKGSKLWYS